MRDADMLHPTPVAFGMGFAYATILGVALAGEPIGLQGTAVALLLSMAFAFGSLWFYGGDD